MIERGSYRVKGASGVFRAGGRTPRTPRSGGPHACSGASCCVGEPFWAHQNAKNLLVAGAPPRTPLGKLTALPRPLAGGEGGFAAPSSRTPLTILSLCLSCVYVHTCMKMHCYFLLNVKHGASQLYLGGGLQVSSAGTGYPVIANRDDQGDYR